MTRVRATAIREVAQDYGLPHGQFRDLFYRPPRAVCLGFYSKIREAFLLEGRALIRETEAAAAEARATDVEFDTAARSR